MPVEQLTLESAPVVHVDRAKPPRTPDEKWAAFLAANPHVLDQLADAARQLSKGGKRVSINRVFEELRERIHTTGDTWRLNNTYRRPAAEALIARWPAEFADLFELRKRRSRPA